MCILIQLLQQSAGKNAGIIDDPLDPEQSAEDPEKIADQLQRIADANGITINEIEFVNMIRDRENARMKVLEKLQKQFPVSNCTHRGWNRCPCS